MTVNNNNILSTVNFSYIYSL